MTLNATVVDAEAMPTTQQFYEEPLEAVLEKVRKRIAVSTETGIFRPIVGVFIFDTRSRSMLRFDVVDGELVRREVP